MAKAAKAEMKDNSVEELKTQLNQQRRSLFKMRLIKASGEEKVQTHKIKEFRRSIARIKTRLAQLAQRTEGKQS